MQRIKILVCYIYCQTVKSMVTKETWIRTTIAKNCNNKIKLNQNRSLKLQRYAKNHFKSWFHWMDTVTEWKKIKLQEQR